MSMGRLCVGQNRHERLVQFMRQGPQQIAHVHQARVGRARHRVRARQRIARDRLNVGDVYEDTAKAHRFSGTRALRHPASANQALLAEWMRHAKFHE